ncbi:MAG: peptidylprolyl isomerase [Chitinophagaceae bacterium]
MKQTLAALFVLIVCTVQSQTLFTYGKKSVNKEEFLLAYNKNNTSASKTEKAYRDYLDLYTRFKLKVQAAYDAKLDTLSGQAAELQNFREQIVDGFMNDESSVQLLVDEAFERSQKDLRVSNIYIPFRGGDTLAAFGKAMEAYNKIQSGTDFAAVAEMYSADPAVHTTKGDIGFITAFTLPYEFETIVYTTPVGKTAKPYRSKTAYLIFKTTAERPAIGRIKAAQILIAFLPNPDDAEKEKKKNLADSVYNALLKGASFKDMVARYSNDNIGYQSGGLLPAFGTGRYSEDFEKAAFSLAKDGEISKPVLTSFGYHIIMRVERNPVNSDKRNKEAMGQLKQAVQADNRILVAKQMLARKVMKNMAFKMSAFDEKQFLAYADSMYTGKKPKQLPSMNDRTLLFSFPQQKLTAADFAKYIHGILNAPDMLRGKSTPQLLQQYAESVAMEYYRNHLEQYNKEFASQLKEFKDGNLLFEIMQRQVWDRAASDTVGLKHYYNNNKNKYWWEASADVILFTCSDSSNAVKAKKSFMQAPADWKTLVQNSDGTIQADSGRFELSQLPVSVSKDIKPGNISEPVKNAADNSTSFAYVIKMHNNRMPRNFEDARGFVINDYQAFLENKWIEMLKKKYPVKVNEAVLQSCWK